MRSVRIPLACCLLALGGAAAAPAEPAWRSLWNGKDLAGWETFLSKPDPAWDVPGLARDDKGNYLENVGKDRDPLNVFKIETVDGRPAIHISGQGFGVMATRESFENFHLRLEMKWGERRWGKKANAPRDSGLLYHCHGEPGAVDGNWPRSVEFQIQEHDTGDLYALGTHIQVRARADSARHLDIYDPSAEPALFGQRLPTGNRCVKGEDREKPNGEWNTLELIVLADQSIHVVNGGVVMRLSGARRLDGPSPAPLTSGRISLQTEGAELYYRNVEIRSISAIPPAYAER